MNRNPRFFSYLKPYHIQLKSKLSAYINITRLNKPIGIFLLLWPTLSALWLAGNGKPDPFVVFIFILGTIVMRSAGCVINDLIDAKFDPFVTRTKQRPLVTGQLSKKEALLFFIFLVCIALVLVLQLNFLTLQMSCIALLLASIYPFMKRYTHLPQVVLGAAFGWSIPMAYSALNNQISFESFWLFAAMLLWTIAYDTQYAMVDKADDIRINVKSTAILFGEKDKSIILLLQMCTIILLTLLGLHLKLQYCFYFGLCAAMVLVFYQQYLIKDRIPEQCFKAFLNNHYFGLAIFLGIFFGSTL